MDFSDFFDDVFMIFVAVFVALPMAFSVRVVELSEKIANVRDKVAGFLGIGDWYY